MPKLPMGKSKPKEKERDKGAPKKASAPPEAERKVAVTKSDGGLHILRDIEQQMHDLTERVEVLEAWRKQWEYVPPVSKPPEWTPPLRQAGDKKLPTKAGPMAKAEPIEEPDEFPGFIKTKDAQGNDAREVDPNMIAKWDEYQMMAVAAYLEEDLSKYEGQPREMRRVLTDLLENYGLTPTEDVEAERPKAKLGKMPVDVKVGDDGLPTVSPIIGKATDEHVERDDWRTNGKFLKLHMYAEQFRHTLAAEGKWVCEGFNCHDCVEELENVNRVVYCHRDFTQQKKPVGMKFPAAMLKYVTDVTPEDEEGDWAKGLIAYATKHEEDEDE